MSVLEAIVAPFDATGAPCVQSGNPDAWHPTANPSEQYAAGLCAHCPLTAECLEFALKLEKGTGKRYGVWAGTTASQRSLIAVRRNRRGVSA